jgi:hypothetical protein
MKTPKLISTIWLTSLMAFSTSALSPVLYAQSQDNSSQSVAEAARKAKEQKKGAAKDAKVITDDTIHLRPASADSGAPPSGTVVTSAPAGEATPRTDSAVPAPDSTLAKAPAPVVDAKNKEVQDAEVAKAKELLAQVQAELDVLKRELALDSDNYFSNADYAHDKAGKAKLDDVQKMIGDKQVSVEELKRQLADLLQKAGISPDADKTSAPPKN